MLAWLRKWCLIIGALVCFACVLFLVLVRADATGGTLMAGLFVVLVLMHSIPEMESFKAFSIEAKWRARLTEADKILGSLRAILAMFGKTTYHTFGLGSRMSHPVREKQKLANELDTLLRANGISDADISAMKESYIHFCLYDINSVLQRVKERLAINQTGKLTSDAIDLRLTDPGQHDIVKAKSARVLAYNQQNRENFPRDGFLNWCVDSIPPSELLEPEDEKILREFAERCGKAGEACVREGRLNEDGVAIIELSGGGTDQMFENLFGRKP